MHNLNKKEKVITLILSIPLFVLSFFLLSQSSGLLALGASKEYQNNTEDTETIYERRECADGVCRDAGKKLIQFKGGDAECENYKSEDERMQCYSRNSQSSFSCTDLENKGEVEDCYEKNGSATFVQNQGGAGTLVVSNSMTVGGSRVYMNGFNCHGEHNVITGTQGDASAAMTFRDGSRDVEYGGSLNTGGNGLVVLSEEGGIYFGSDVEYSEGDINSEGLRGQTMTVNGTNNGMNLNKCRGMQMVSNNNNLITIAEDGDDYEDQTDSQYYGRVDSPWKIEDPRYPFAAVEIESGLEVNGDMKIDKMIFRDKFLVWSEPIRGHHILMYRDDQWEWGGEPEDPSSCAETPYPR